MENFARFLLRLLLVPVGAMAAITVAMMVVLAAHWNEIVALANADPDAQGDWLLAFVFAGPILALLLSLTLAMTALPAAVGVLISEAFAIRSWIFHALNGGLGLDRLVDHAGRAGSIPLPDRAPGDGGG